MRKKKKFINLKCSVLFFLSSYQLCSVTLKSAPSAQQKSEVSVNAFIVKLRKRKLRRIFSKASWCARRRNLQFSWPSQFCSRAVSWERMLVRPGCLLGLGSQKCWSCSSRLHPGFSEFCSLQRSEWPVLSELNTWVFLCCTSLHLFVFGTWNIIGTMNLGEYQRVSGKSPELLNIVLVCGCYKAFWLGGRGEHK